MKILPIFQDKYISTFIGSLAIYIGVAFILPINNFTVYITSYIHLKQNYVTMHYGMFINLLFTFSNSFSSPLGGYLENLLGFRKTIIFGFIILFIGNLFFISQQNIWFCYLLSIIMGMGAGIGTSVIGKNLILFRPNKKGTIGGILSLGILFIVSLFAIIGEKIISFGGYTLKNGEQFYPEEIANRTYKYFLFGEFCIPLGLILSFLFIYEFKPEYTENIQENMRSFKNTKNEQNTEEEKEPVFLEEETNGKNEKIQSKIIDNNELIKENSKKNAMKAINTIRYWKIALISFFINFSISFMINTGRTFGALIGIKGTVLQFSMIIQGISLIIVGPIFGILSDKKGPLFILRIISILTIISGILLFSFMEITWIFIIAFMISTISIAGLMSSFSPFIMEIYGIKESVILGGIINSFSKLSDIITTITAFVVSLYFEGDKLKTPYRVMYLISAIFCSLSSFLLFNETQDKFIYEKNLIDNSLDKKENELAQIPYN